MDGLNKDNLGFNKKSYSIRTNSFCITCDEASKARNISLSSELKTLLLQVGHLFIAVHLRGSDKVNVGKIKKTFRYKNITFMDQHHINQFGLKKGIINPWNVSFCQFHLLCCRVLTNMEVATNSGKFTEGIYFNPKKLLYLPNVIYGEFGK